MSVKVSTITGHISLHEDSAPGKCVACPNTSELLRVEVFSTTNDPQEGSFRLCGTCLSGALGGRIDEYIERSKRHARSRS